MKIGRIGLGIVMTIFGVAAGMGAPNQLVKAKDGSGVVGYKHTPIQPWSGFHTHDPDRPAPPKVDPGPAQPPAPAPADALALFDGQDVAKWQPSTWTVQEGCLVAGDGFLTTKEEFSDCQLHVEWAVPEKTSDNPMNRGNNGVQMLGLFEVQIFDSYNEKLYPDGQAASIYAQTPPLVNVCRKPGEWQSFDIFVTAPMMNGDTVEKPARLTMLHNGVLVHLNQEVYGSSPHAGLATYAGAKNTGTIALMGHHEPVKFRNIWLRKLNLKQAQAGEK